MTASVNRTYCDNRMGGVKRYFGYQPEDWNVRIPENITNSVCFLCVKITDGPNAGQYKTKGTAFFVGLEESGIHFGYTVTARHVIDGIRKEGWKEVFARVNRHEGDAIFIRLSIDWIIWKNDAVDIAILPFIPDPQLFNFEALPLGMLATDEKIKEHGIGLGDELFVTGLFTFREGKQRNIPILRTGVIAAMPDEPLTSKDGNKYMAYLAELRSISGLSGSPVFVFIDRQRSVDPKIPDDHDWLYFLVGLIRGHWDLKRELINQAHDAESEPASQDYLLTSKGEDLNVGIAIVTPAQYLVGILMSEPLREQRTRFLEMKEKENLPTEDSASDVAVEKETFTKDDFQTALRRVSSKVSEPESKDSETSE